MTIPIETFIHTPEGELKQDLPWYLVEGARARVIDANGLIIDGIPGIRNGDLVRATKDSIRQTNIYLDYVKSKGREIPQTVYFVKDDSSDDSSCWIGSLKCLESEI